MASIRNASLDNDSSTQLFRVTSFTEGPKYKLLLIISYFYFTIYILG